MESESKGSSENEAPIVCVCDSAYGEGLSGDPCPPSSKIPLISKTKPFTNIIHRWFTVDGANGKCSICALLIKGKHGTHLMKHLEKKHPSAYANYVDEKRKAQNDHTKPNADIFSEPYRTGTTGSVRYG